MALKQWPDKSQHIIAAQIGVAQQRISEVKKQVTGNGNLDHVTGKDGKSYPASPQLLDGQIRQPGRGGGHGTL